MESIAKIKWGRFIKSFRKLTRRKLSLIGLIVVIINIFLAIFGDMLAPYEQTLISTAEVLNPPSAAHWFGTDELGRDLFSRILGGAKYSILVGIVAVSIALVLGTNLGLVSGFWQGRVDTVITCILDAMWSFPTMILALAIAAILGSGITNIMIAIGIVYTPSFARLVRSRVKSIRESEYVEAAIAVGMSKTRIIFKYVLPNTTSLIIVQASLNAAQAIIAEASLSFLGVGIQPPDASWGYILKMGFRYADSAPWLSIAPGVMILLLVLGLNFLGDGLRDTLDVRLLEE